MLVLRVALGTIGLAFLLLGLWDALRLVRKSDSTDQPIRGATDPSDWADLVRATVDLVKVSPRWLLFILVGVALVVLSVLL